MRCFPQVFENCDVLAKYADHVANAVSDWASERDATMYTHIFQPMGSEAVRHGMSGQVHQAMFKPSANGLVNNFWGDKLLQNETDGSSFQNGERRAAEGPPRATPALGRAGATGRRTRCSASTVAGVTASPLPLRPSTPRPRGTRTSTGSPSTR